jgi:hypothetical protein
MDMVEPFGIASECFLERERRSEMACQGVFVSNVR